MIHRQVGTFERLSDAALALPTRPANLDRDHPVYMQTRSADVEPSQPTQVGLGPLRMDDRAETTVPGLS